MAPPIQVLLLAFAFYLRAGTSLEIQSLQLKGGKGEYIQVGTGARYVLSCIFRSGYDDPVSKVTWFLYGNPVYIWTATTDYASVSGPLLGRVDSSPENEPASLHFTDPDYYIAGNYTCRVDSAQNTVEETYQLHVIDISPIPFNTSVHILKDLEEAESEDIKYITYDVDSQPEAVAEFENSHCTLVWNFQSPAIFPKPNVTCGYYSFNHDDVVQYLPAGLTMHKFMNGSWQASFDSTRVQVSSIPADHRLGCSIKIPETTYREIVVSKDDFAVDNLIDSSGCPGVEDVKMEKGLQLEYRDSSINCRGNLIPDNREAPAIIKLSCPEGTDAIFPDGTRESEWWTELSCYEYDQLWRSYQEGMSEGELIDVRELPSCDRSLGAANAIPNSAFLALLVMIQLLVHIQNH